MKVRLVGKKVFGIELTSETREEEEALKGFWERGVKINCNTTRATNYSLELTFADLVKEKK